MLGYPRTVGVFLNLPAKAWLALGGFTSRAVGSKHNLGASQIRFADKKSRFGGKLGMDGIKVVRFSSGEFGPWDIDVAPSVYPPREDTELLCRSLSGIQGRGRKAVEIGCGSGVISMALAQMGWRVEGFDINPYAVACSRANIEKFGFSDSVKISEGGLGEDNWSISEDVELVVWNLPYLTPPEEGEPKLEPIEEASMSDLGGGGWSSELLQYLSRRKHHDLVVIALFRIDPESPSKASDWLNSGWSCRNIESLRIGDEKLGVFGLWKTGFGIKESRVGSCSSTMDYASNLPDEGWQRVVADNQDSGRGRRGSVWKSEEGDLVASWRINRDLSELPTPGILQISIGAVVSNLINCELKWPNDLVTKGGGKIGGVLIEANSSNPGFRLGVGINSFSRDLDGRLCPGWRETFGEFSRDYIFNAVDSRISSIIEKDDRIPDSHSSDLERMSWSTLSRSLSRGVGAIHDGEEVRVVGIDSDGFLHVDSRGERVVLSSTEDIIWNFK